MRATVERAAAVALGVATLIGVVTGLERYRNSLTVGDVTHLAKARVASSAVTRPAVVKHDTAPIAAANPFLLAAEVESGKEWVAPAPVAVVAEPGPGELVLQGVILVQGGSQAIVNGAAVNEGETIEVAGQRVKLVSVALDRASFSLGEHVFERGLAPAREVK